MKILITGGAGFIGSNLIKELITSNDVEIISLDNYSTGSVDNHIINEKIKYLKNNTWEIFEIEELKNFKPDYIFHFGEYSRTSYSLEEPSKTFKSNSYGTQQILQYTVQNNSKLIYSGSSAIFGNSGLNQHLNPYSWTKSKNIELIHNYSEWFNLDFCICYFYNVYGPGQINSGPYATVIGIFEEQYKNNKPLTVVKPGTQTRCFTHINDIIKGILTVTMEGLPGHEYHLGYNNPVSILEIVKMFDTEYIFIEEKKGERISSIVKDNKIELGWKANLNIEDYIKFSRKIK